MQDLDKFISEVDLFSGLAPRDRETLLANAQELEFSRRKTIVKASTPAHHLYLFTRGAAKTYFGDHAETQLLADFLKSGDLFGEEALLFSGEYNLNVITYEPSAVIALPAEDIRRFMETNPRLCRALAALALSRARAYRERLYLMSVMPVPARLASVLHLLARRFGKRDRKGTLIALKITHQDLADWVGASRETVTLFLSSFRDEGLILCDVRRIIIPDLKALKKYAPAK